MPRALAPREARFPRPQPFYPEDLLPQMQSMLGALADIDLRYGRDCARIDEWPAAQAIKQALLAELEQRRQQERAPYLRRLSELQRQITALRQPGASRALH